MKLIFKVIILLVLSISISAREKGETEITTDDGIEVFQNEKYYLLKKNVKIVSDDYEITSDKVKAKFQYFGEKWDAFGTLRYVKIGRGSRLSLAIRRRLTARCLNTTPRQDYHEITL